MHPNSGKPELSVVYLRFIFGYLRLFLRYPVDISDVSPDISVARLTYRRMRRAEQELSVWI